MSTLLVTHPACLDHLTPLAHPERPDRLRAIEQALSSAEFAGLTRAQAPRAPFQTIALCHPIEHIEHIRAATPQQGIVRIEADTSPSPGSFAAALRAAG